MSANPAIIGDEFRRGFRHQTQWGWSMATAFFFGETGAGLFLVSLLFDFLPGLVGGLLLTAVGKTAGHLVHLGQPARAWRAIARLDRSWVSRGLLAIVVFTGCGALYCLHLAHATLGLLPGAAAPYLGALAGVAALAIMLYQGFAMSHSSSIALWNTGMMPLFGLAYASLAGLALSLSLGIGTGAQDLLRTLEQGLIVYALIMHFSLLHAAWHGAIGARRSAELLLKGELAWTYLGAVIVLGLVIPGILTALEAPGIGIAATACVLAGYYAFRVVMFKAGVYDPPQGFSPKLRRFG